MTGTMDQHTKAGLLVNGILGTSALAKVEALCFVRAIDQTDMMKAKRIVSCHHKLLEKKI